MSFFIDTPGVIRRILEGVDIEQLQEIEDKLFEGVDKERLLDSALNLLKNLDFEELNKESIPDSWGYLPYGGFYIVIAILIILQLCFFWNCS